MALDAFNFLSFSTQDGKPSRLRETLVNPLFITAAIVLILGIASVPLRNEDYGIFKTLAVVFVMVASVLWAHTLAVRDKYSKSDEVRSFASRIGPLPVVHNKAREQMYYPSQNSTAFERPAYSINREEERSNGESNQQN